MVSTIPLQFDGEMSVAILDELPDGILVVNGAGRIVFATRRAGELFHCESGGLVGKSIESLLPADVRQAHRSHRNRYRADPQVRPMAAGIILRARRQDGSEFPVDISLSPFRRGDELFVVAAVRDITTRLGAEEYLQRMIVTLDAADDAVFLADPDSLCFFHVNEGAVRQLGLTREELLGLSLPDINADLDVEELRKMVDGLRSDPGTSGILVSRHRHRDGHEVPVEIVLQCMPPGHDGVGWLLASARDIAHRLASEESARRAEQAIALLEDHDRIARDLHDKVIQRLFAAGLNLQGLLGTLDQTTQLRLQGVVDELDTTIRELRMTIFGLLATEAQTASVRVRILDVVTQAGEALGSEPSIRFNGPLEILEQHVADHLISTLREAMTNIVKHAQATSVDISVDVGSDIALQVTDDGIGIPDTPQPGYGLRNMAKRAEELGGDFAIAGGDPKGSVLTWRVPTS